MWRIRGVKGMRCSVRMLVKKRSGESLICSSASYLLWFVLSVLHIRDSIDLYIYSDIESAQKITSCFYFCSGNSGLFLNNYCSYYTNNWCTKYTWAKLTMQRLRNSDILYSSGNYQNVSNGWNVKAAKGSQP